MARRWLEIRLEEGAARAVLHSVPHRVPRAVRVPLAVATRLAANGVPTVVHHRRNGADVAQAVR